MALTPVTYGSTNLNDGINYIVTKRTIPFPKISPSMFKIGRLEGMKKVGENINERQIQIEMRIIGVSRADLETKIDTLQQALFQRGQNLVMHTNDSRYYICDCIDFKYDLGPGNVITTTAQVSFVAYAPFAYAPSQSTYDTGTVIMPGGSGAQLGPVLYTQTFNVTGGGNVYNRPVIRLYQRTPAMQTTMTGTTLVVGQIYGSISCNATTADLQIGDDLILTSGSHSQSVVVAAFTPAGSTTITTGGFAPGFAYAAGTTITRDLTWQSIQMNQTTDNQALSITTSLPAKTGDYLDINCDPLQANGYTVILNSSGVLSTIQGSFPVLEPVSTPYTFSIFANSVPQIELVWTYTSRWLS